MRSLVIIFERKRGVRQRVLQGLAEMSQKKLMNRAESGENATTLTQSAQWGGQEPKEGAVNQGHIVGPTGKIVNRSYIE